MTLRPNFEVFDVRYKKPSEGPTLAIQRRGAFALNREAFDELGSPEAVYLLFDPQQRIIGLAKKPGGVPGVYPVTMRSTGKTYIINALAFCKHYGIDLSEARLFSAQMIGDTLAVDIKEPLEIVTRHSLAGYSGMGERVASRADSATG